VVEVFDRHAPAEAAAAETQAAMGRFYEAVTPRLRAISALRRRKNMNDDKPKSAIELWRKNVAESKEKNSGVLKAEDDLPSYPDGDQFLHPYEIAIFEIDPELRWELYEAWHWYSGAIALMDENGYEEFADEERMRFPHLVKTGESEQAQQIAIFDHEDCATFMHEAAGLPMRQCEAWCVKTRAMELRDHAYNTFKDGS
jgi:hypothetical protein